MESSPLVNATRIGPLFLLWNWGGVPVGAGVQPGDGGEKVGQVRLKPKGRLEQDHGNINGSLLIKRGVDSILTRSNGLEIAGVNSKPPLLKRSVSKYPDSILRSNGLAGFIEIAGVSSKSHYPLLNIDGCCLNLLATQELVEGFIRHSLPQATGSTGHDFPRYMKLIFGGPWMDMGFSFYACTPGGTNQERS